MASEREAEQKLSLSESQADGSKGDFTGSVDNPSLVPTEGRLSSPYNVPSTSVASKSSGSITLARGTSRDTMQRSSEPPESSSAIKYTRTGRVSKATKGQPIHHCDSCGKTYSRAEHLRRHQQNHKPGEYPCDVPGCDRSFYREDLLTRHKVRHNDPQNPPSRRQSVSSPHSASSHDHGVLQTAPLSSSVGLAVDSSTSASYDPQPASSTAPQQPNASRAPRKDYIPINELPMVTSGVAMSMNSASSQNDHVFTRVGFGPSPSYSPSGYNSPTDDYTSAGEPPYYAQPHAYYAPSGLDTTAYTPNALQDGCTSPGSIGSSTAYMPHWPLDTERSYGARYGSSVSGSDAAFCEEGSRPTTFGGHGLHLIPLLLHGTMRMISAVERDGLESVDLPVPMTCNGIATFGTDIDNSTMSDTQRYLDSYWTIVHAVNPVVSRQSFHLPSASPLLISAILALGAHMLQSRPDMEAARVIHERCCKVIQKRTLHDWHTYRICDMQAIILTEYYSVFKSRRPGLYFSKAFLDVYRRLANDSSLLGSDIIGSMRDTPIGSSFSGTLEWSDGAWNPGADDPIKQRLLLSCYVLDSQHHTLFGRPRTGYLGILNTRSTEQGELVFSPVPVVGTGWYEQVHAAVSALQNTSRVSADSLDAFRQILTLASTMEFSEECQRTDIHSPLTFQQSPRIQFAYHIIMLLKHIPVRDLLAVAGESWVGGTSEKLASQQEFTSSQLVARDWAKGYTPVAESYTQDERPEIRVNVAVRHALALLGLHHRQPRSGWLWQEWALYLAALVIWAKTYALRDEADIRSRTRLSIPSPTEPTIPPHTLEQTVLGFAQKGLPNSGPRWEDAKCVLLWTKGQIEKVDVPHNCGLTNGALDVLGKLVVRGWEGGWFG